MHAFFPVRREFGRALEQVLVAIDVEHRGGRGTSQWMSRIGVAVEQVDGALRPVHQAVEHVLANEHATHRHRGVGDALGHRHQVGNDAELLGGEARTQAAEAGDDLVEDQQDAMLVADLAQPLEVALGRRQVAGRAGAGLDDNGGDVGGIVQTDDAFQRVGELRAVLGLALRERILRQVRVRHVVDARQHGAEPFAVVDHAADRDTAEADAVIAALAPDEAGAGALAVGPVKGERDLERAVDGLGAGVAIEGVIEVARQHRGMARRQFEGLGMAHLERWRVVHLVELLGDRRLDLLAAMASVDAPKTRGSVDDLAPLRRPIVDTFRLGQHPRVLLELPVRRERHEEGFEIVGNRLGIGRGHRRCSSANCKINNLRYHLFTSTTTRPRISPLRIFGARAIRSERLASLTMLSSLSSGRSVPSRRQATSRGALGSITESMP